MKEYIERVEAIKAIVAEASHCLVLDKPAEARGYIGAKELIEHRKAADVVEVVRCDNCERRYEEDGEYICGRTGMPCADDEFCSHGIRMDKEVTT